MKRRTLMIGLGGLATSGATAIGTGAFTTVEAERDVQVDVVNDQEAYVALEPVNRDGEAVDEGRIPEAQDNPFALVDENTGRLELNLTALNTDAETVITSVFRIANLGAMDDVLVYIEQDGGNENVLSFQDQNGNNLDGDDNGVELDVGEDLIVDVVADTRGVAPGDDIVNSITIVGTTRGEES